MTSSQSPKCCLFVSLFQIFSNKSIQIHSIWTKSDNSEKQPLQRYVFIISLFAMRIKLHSKT